MALTIELPQVGESVMEGTIQKWLKQPGDHVDKYDPLVEVVTDKVTMELPSPVSGVLLGLLVEEGATVPMGTPICEMETSETPTEALAAAPQGSPAVAETRETPPIGTTGVLVDAGGVMGPTGVREVAKEEARAQAPERKERSRLSPVVQKLATEHSISLDEVSRIPGSGLGGRVTKQDLLKHIHAQSAQVPAAAAPTPPAQGEAPEEETVSLTPIRKRIAEHMVQSAREIPMAWSMVEADVTGLVQRRESLKEEFRHREGVNLTYLPFTVKAVVEALREHPKLNSQWGGDKIILKQRINLGIAVGAPQGLVVPVVHDADHYSIAGLARAITEVVDRARENTLRLEDIQGGTFTINNTGALGSVVSQPIINYPQAAILTTEAVVKRPVVVGDAIGIRSVMNVCLSFDHRILDGLEAGAFLLDVKQRLEAMGEETAIY